jgi:hypothetical protein
LFVRILKEGGMQSIIKHLDMKGLDILKLESFWGVVVHVWVLVLGRSTWFLGNLLIGLAN